MSVFREKKNDIKETYPNCNPHIVTNRNYCGTFATS